MGITIDYNVIKTHAERLQRRQMALEGCSEKEKNFTPYDLSAAYSNVSITAITNSTQLQSINFSKTSMQHQRGFLKLKLQKYFKRKNFVFGNLLLYHFLFSLNSFCFRTRWAKILQIINVKIRIGEKVRRT